MARVKQENTKLKDENDYLKKNCDYLEKFFKNIKSNSSQKLTSIEFANIMSTKENELNEARRIMHTTVNRIKSYFENLHDEFAYTLNENMKNYIEGKTIEDKFIYYYEKIFKYLEVIKFYFSIKKRKRRS